MPPALFFLGRRSLLGSGVTPLPTSAVRPRNNDFVRLPANFATLVFITRRLSLSWARRSPPGRGRESKQRGHPPEVASVARVPLGLLDKPREVTSWPALVSKTCRPPRT